MWPLRVLNHRAAIAPLALASVLLTAQAPLPEPVTDTETELGQAVYDELKTKGEIIASALDVRRLSDVLVEGLRSRKHHRPHLSRFERHGRRAIGDRRGQRAANCRRDRPLTEGGRGHSRRALPWPRHSARRRSGAEARSEDKTVKCPVKRGHLHGSPNLVSA